ncbi:MAG: 8-oxo-dGTP diphosphatase [Candidatus Cloacimonadota bacterium]|nr:8-oxo-dGTP diphosphatase [Candidatus Cloacimonadota bacterium]
MAILATLCYLKKENQTLMLYRNKKKDDIHEGKYNGLGGKLKAGETPEECAKREIWEESGLNAEKLLLKGIITFPKFDGKNDWYVFVYLVPKFNGTIIDSPEGRLEWVEDSNLNDIRLWEGDYIFMPWLHNDCFFSAKFTYKEGKLKSHRVEFY